MLSKNTFLLLLGILFSLGALVHLYRLIFGFSVVIEGWIAPQWMSGIAVVIALYLAINAFKLRRNANGQN